MGLTTQIERSKSPEKIENEVHSGLEEAKALMKHVKKSGNEELIHQFNKEYQDIRNVMSKSLETDRAFSISERTRIKLELSDLLSLADEHEVSDKIKKGQKVINGLQGVNNNSINRIKEESLKLTTTPIGKLNIDESIGALMYINHNYNTIIDKTLSWGEDTIKSLDSESEVHDFQQRLINKIIGEGNNFGSGFVKGFSEKRGFYLKTEQDCVEKYNKLPINTVNQESLSNYMDYMFAKNFDNSKKLGKELISFFGKDKSNEMLAVWKNQHDDSSIFDSAVAGVFEIVNKFNDKEDIINNLQNHVNEINDPIIQKYISEEIIKLSGNKESDDWTILLLSYTKNLEWSMVSTGNDKQEGFGDSIQRVIHNTAQASMIQNVLGNNSGYNNEFIHGYNSRISNYLVKIDDFERTLQTTSVSEWNSLAVKNYFLSIGSQGKLNTDFLIQKFGKNKINELGKLWNKSDTGDTGIHLAKDSLENKGLGNFIKNVTLFENIFNDPKNISIHLNNLSIEQLDSFGEIIEQDLYNYGSQFRELLLSKMDKIENPQEKVNELIKKLRTVKDFNILKEISLWKDKHEVDVGLKETTKIYQKICDGESKKELIEKHEQLALAKQQNRNIEIKKLEKDIYNIETQIISNSNFSRQTEVLNEDELNTIANQLIKGKDINIILNEIAENNTELNTVLNEIKEDEENHLEGRSNKKSSNEDFANNSLTYNNYIFDKDSENPTIETQDGKKIPIDKEEAKMVQKNPDAMENIVNFYTFFTELNLQSAWDLRTDLALAMGVSNINLHDDGLKKSELIAYGNKLLQVMNNLDPRCNNLDTNNNTIGSLKANFNEYTGTKSILSANKTHGSEGEDKFKYDLRMCGIYNQNHGIQISEFRNQTKKETTV